MSILVEREVALLLIVRARRIARRMGRLTFWAVSYSKCVERTL